MLSASLFQDTFFLKEAAVFEIVLDDDVGDGVEDEADVVGVGGAREVRVHLLGVLPLVQVLELQLDVARGVLVGLGAWKKRRKRDDECNV